MNIVIRPETPADYEGIRHVNRLAFGQDAEARLIEGLREGGYVRLSLLAEQAAEVVGHILFSDLPISTEAGTVHALALAPMAVLPDFPKQGIGSALVRRGLEECRQRGHKMSRIQRGWAMLKDELERCCRFEFDRRGNVMDYEPRPDRTVCRDCGE